MTKTFILFRHGSYHDQEDNIFGDSNFSLEEKGKLDERGIVQVFKTAAKIQPYNPDVIIYSSMLRTTQSAIITEAVTGTERSQPERFLHENFEQYKRQRGMINHPEILQECLSQFNDHEVICAVTHQPNIEKILPVIYPKSTTSLQEKGKYNKSIEHFNKRARAAVFQFEGDD